MEKDLFQFTMGDFKCLAIRDGGHSGSADFLFINAPEDELDKALREHNLKRDQFWSTWTCLLVDTGDVKLLVDTGIGSGDVRGGNLLSQMERSGVQPDDIDSVFLTHAHADHLGGCIGADGKPAFPRARYLIAKREFGFWTGVSHQDEMHIRMAQFARSKLIGIEDQLELVDADTEIYPGVKTLAAYGHTPGHLSLEIRSQGEILLNLADSVLHPLQIEQPQWYAHVDVLPEQMIATRTRLLKHAAREKALVLFFHFAFPGLGYVDQAGDHWIWRPI